MLNIKSFGLAGGVTYGLLIFVLTILGTLLGKGTMLLGIFVDLFPMYTISLVGSIIGLVYGFILGFVTLYLIAYVYNHFEA